MNSHAVLVGLASSDINGISAYPATIGVLLVGRLRVGLLLLKCHVCTPKLSDDCASAVCVVCAGALSVRQSSASVCPLQKDLKRRIAPSTPTPQKIADLSPRANGIIPKLKYAAAFAGVTLFIEPVTGCTVAILPSALLMNDCRSVRLGRSRCSQCCHLIGDLQSHLSAVQHPVRRSAFPSVYDR
jgi:hypothetical protein